MYFLNGVAHGFIFVRHMVPKVYRVSEHNVLDTTSKRLSCNDKDGGRVVDV